MLEAEAGRHQEVLDSTTAHNKQQIEKLYQDKALLEVTSFFNFICICWLIQRQLLHLLGFVKERAFYDN